MMDKFVRKATDKLKNKHGIMDVAEMLLIIITGFLLLGSAIYNLCPTHDKVAVYGDDGMFLETYSGDNMNIRLSENHIKFTYNQTDYSFTTESYTYAGNNSYKVVIDDNTAKNLGLKANGTSNPVNKDTDNTVSDNSSSDGSQSSQECSNAATVAVKFAKGKIESDSVVSPTLISDTQAYLAKLNYDKSIIVQEIAVKGGKVKVVVSKDDCTDNNSETKTSSVNYSGSDVDLK